MESDRKSFLRDNKRKSSTLNGEEALYQIELTKQEKIHCLKGIIKKHYKVLHVYEQEVIYHKEKYNYKMFTHALVLYVSTSNILFNGRLVDILINLCTIIEEDLAHEEIKRLVFDNLNYANFLLDYIKREG